jgi:hypothetical protein
VSNYTIKTLESARDGNNKGLTITCDGTQKVLGGGGYPDSFQVWLASSFPSASNRWSVTAHEANPGPVADWVLTAYAICADVP